MAGKLLELYKKDLSLLQIMFKKFQWKGFLCSIISLVVIIIVIIFIKTCFKSDWTNASFFLLIISFFLFLKDSRKEKDRIINSDHNGKNYDQIRLDGLRRFLRNESIDTDLKKIELLIQLVEKQAEELKVPFFVGRGILLTVLLPIVSATYTNILNKYADDLTTVLILFSTIVIIIISVFIYATILRFIYEISINGDYQRYKTIANDLRELHFKLL